MRKTIISKQTALRGFDPAACRFSEIVAAAGYRFSCSIDSSPSPGLAARPAADQQ
jgi:hypothetical protein